MSRRVPQHDLQRATDIARLMVTQYGMSESLGLVSFEEVRSPFLATRTVSRQEHSKDTSRLIDAEIRKFLSESHDRVRETLTAKRSILESLATLLEEHEVIDRAALEAITAGAPVPA